MNNYARIERVIGFLNEHWMEQPSLADIAKSENLSEFHLQRLFSEWAGISPKTFLKQITLQHAKKILHQGAAVLETSMDVGLSGPSRLHDLCVTLEAATPGEIKSGGSGWVIQYGFYRSPFGLTLICSNVRGICYISFVNDDLAAKKEALTEAQSEWQNAEFEENETLIQGIGDSVFEQHGGGKGKTGTKIKAFVKGSEMQVKVWRALLEIPEGKVTTYGDIAAGIENEKAARAVGSAVGKNSLAYLIPCHRVIRKSGAVSEYRWGKLRKQAILAREMAQLDTLTK